MAASVFVVARFRAKEGQENELKQVLARLVMPTRRELGCYQYDLLENPDDPRDLCFLEKWEDDRSLDRHVAGDFLQKTITEAGALIDGTPQGARYRLV
jgi:quinol monooxygenase YgiN